MHRFNQLVLLAVSIVAALAISACGGDDDDGGDSGGSDEDAQITEVIETSVKSSDPADCTTLQTQKFVEQIQFESGAEAVASCEEDAADTSDDPDSVEVSSIEVEGTNATADVSFVGSPFDGSTLSLALVKEGDQWKLDEITDIPEFDFEAFQASFSEELTADGDVPPEVATCIGDSFSSAGADTVKEAFISGDEAQLTALFGDCLGGA